MATDADDTRKRSQLREAEAEIESARLLADVQIAAFFEGGTTATQRNEKRKEFAELVQLQRNSGDTSGLEAISKRLRSGDRTVMPFNWEVEFPEVFDRENPGFDAIVGNPPFAGKNTITAGNAEGYLHYLKESYPESHGNSDLVAYFFRRAFNLSRQSGTLGLIATNTIAQGDTRSTGLRYICKQGGTIYNAKKRQKWTGLAAVVVSVLQIVKGEYSGKKTLDDRPVDYISAFLFNSQNNDDPKTLIANAGKSFIGSYVLGMGFTFDDSNPDATPIAEMHRLIEKDPRNKERIFPYIGGEEVNSSPTHAHHRYVINFGEMSEDEARKWADLMAIVEEKVKPQRLRQNREIRKRYWWRFGEPTPALFKAIAHCDRVLVCTLHAPYLSFTFLPANSVFSHALAIFPLETNSAFVLLQSSPHELWARFLGSSMKDDLRYTPSSCFETFPFPKNWEDNTDLEAIGETYYEFRADLMVKNNEGLTATYNRFHDPAETDPEILTLRDLHSKMDDAVLAAYGWQDLDTTCGFALDYLDLDEEAIQQLPTELQVRIYTNDLWFPNPTEAVYFDVTVRQTTSSRRKLPWRYRWTDETRDIILAKLLDLNQQRYEEELRGISS
ncbi:MAG: Eco57I restriction-modification methylase domain-containing protein [Cyanophyceae cyanobacterium]